MTAATDRARKRTPSAENQSAILDHHKSTPYLFSAPAIIAVTIVLLFPVLYGIWQSFYRPTSLGGQWEWVGLQNYLDMFRSPEFWNSLYRTAIFAAGSMILGTALGLFFAFALYRVVGRLRFLRSVSLAPYLISNVAAAVMFRLLFNGQFGLINVWLGWFGIDGPNWFADTGWAMVAVVFAQVWTDLPLTVLLLLGGLMTIDTTYLDAALVDGASGWQRSRYVTIPLLTPQLLINTIWLSYSTVTGLGLVLSLTGGGPEDSTNTLAMQMYLSAFRGFKLHEGLAIATFVLILNAILTVLYIRFSRRYETEL